MTTTTTILGAGALALAITLSGCVVAIGNRGYPDGPDNERWYVGSDQMRVLVNDNKTLRLGMTKADALAIYPDDLTALMSSARVGDKVVEEWRVQAYEGTRTKVKTSFHRWLYFSDAELVRFSESRIDYVSDPALIGAGG